MIWAAAPARQCQAEPVAVSDLSELVGLPELADLPDLVHLAHLLDLSDLADLADLAHLLDLPDLADLQETFTFLVRQADPQELFPVALLCSPLEVSLAISLVARAAYPPLWPALSPLVQALLVRALHPQEADLVHQPEASCTVQSSLWHGTLVATMHGRCMVQHIMDTAWVMAMVMA